MELYIINKFDIMKLKQDTLCVLYVYITPIDNNKYIYIITEIKLYQARNECE